MKIRCFKSWLIISMLLLINDIAYSLDYLIIAPTPIESKSLVKYMTHNKYQKFNTHHYVVGNYKGHSILLTNTGIGKTNVTLTVTHLIDQYNPEHIILYGSAGSLSTQNKIGDVILINQTTDFDLTHLTATGIHIPGFVYKKYFGYPKRINLKLNIPNINTKDFKFRIDVGKSATTDTLPESKRQLAIGKALGYSIFDMEDSSVAYVAKVLRKPLYIIRGVSDTETIPFKKSNFVIASTHASMLVRYIIRHNK